MLSKNILQKARYTQSLLKSPSISSLSFSSCSSKKSLTKFQEHIQQDIMSIMPTAIGKPSLRPTQEREKYSESFDRTPHCNGCSKCGNWSRDVPLMT